MRNLFISTAEATDLIISGQRLIVAGSSAALSTLPRGAWIGGSTPYFMAPEGGLKDHERVFCTVFDHATDSRVDVIPADSVAQVLSGRFNQGFSYVLIPAFGQAHQRFAIEGQNLPNLYAQPLVGWITGIDLDEPGDTSPLVVDGTTGVTHSDAIVVMHVSLDGNYYGEIDILNLFTQGAGDEISFDETGFAATMCQVNGVKTDFASYVRANALDTTLPLVSDYAGAMVNVSFQAIHEAKVEFYAPVVVGRTYRLAAPVGDYSKAYGMCCQRPVGDSVLSFNCILNYLYASLSGKRTGGFIGPVTFGEIAYILLNQTLVRLDVQSAEVALAA